MVQGFQILPLTLEILVGQEGLAYLELLLDQLVQLELACKKMGPVMVLFLHQCFVTGLRMVEYPVAVQEVPDFQEFREFQVFLVILGLHLDPILLLVRIDPRFRMIRMSPQEFHLEVGHSFLEVQAELELPETLQDISDNILPEECKAELDNLFPDS
jgi:hypothetical protein